MPPLTSLPRGGAVAASTSSRICRRSPCRATASVRCSMPSPTIAGHGVSRHRERGRAPTRPAPRSCRAFSASRRARGHGYEHATNENHLAAKRHRQRDRARGGLAARIGIAVATAPTVPISQVPMTVEIPAHPQIMLAVGNSESMDGTLTGAILTGAGDVGATYAALYNSSSPLNFTIPAGFTPPLNAGSGGCRSLHRDHRPAFGTTTPRAASTSRRPVSPRY